MAQKSDNEPEIDKKGQQSQQNQYQSLFDKQLQKSSSSGLSIQQIIQRKNNYKSTSTSGGHLATSPQGLMPATGGQ